jgi:bifunctional non-homologous end joining protein LigD
MALEEYAAKRRFDRTPEPSGKEHPGAGLLRFVVQKHQASHLHYDFRLELDGVLKSWAVPKGPSQNPADKRLAMMVEDHPYDYRNFEGIIPKGQYGGGTVMIWDEGTYTHPDTLDRKEAERLLKKDLSKGEIKIVMAGQKLTGKFVLVHTGNPENAWLLIKEKDEFTSTDDVTAEDNSARTGRSLDQIANASDAVWHSKPRLDLAGTPEAKRPTDLRPMLASLAPAPFSDPNWIYEVKWDGYRIMAQTGRDARLISRGNQDYSERYHEITKDLASWPVEAIVDGEMVVVDDAGLSHFQWLQDWPGKGGQLVYYLFDLTWVDGHDVKNWPLERRREILRQIIPESNLVRFSDHVTGQGEAFYQAAAGAGLEGAMAKRLGSRYQEGRRSKDWLKLKILHEQEAVICGYTQPRGSRQDLGALILGVYESGKLHYIGHTGGGIDSKERGRLKELLEPLEAKSSPFEEKVKTNAPATWVKPKLVCQIKFNGWTATGHVRQPIYMGQREDKSASEVTRERPIKEIPMEKSQSKPKKAQKFEVSHPDKIFWPDDKITKGDMAAYYADIAPVILPYLEGRPESLHRHPNGITGQSFFQKNIDYDVPDFMETVKVHSEGEERDINYLVCDNAQSLEYLVNLGCIELNPWHSRVGRLEQPDYLLLDLDAKTAQFSEIVEVAQAVRQVLEDLDIQSLPKTSGKTGLHVCIPLGAKYDYDQSKQLAELIMRLVLERTPGITSIERSPSKRKGKVYLDYLQNRRGQTMAAPYCVRPVAGATVSAPLTWNEVNNKLDPTAFTIKTMRRRVDKVGDLWQPVLGPGVNVAKLLERFSDA